MFLPSTFLNSIFKVNLIFVHGQVDYYFLQWSKSEIIEEGIGSHGGVWGSAEGFYSPPVDSRTLSPSSEAVSGLLPRVFPQNGGIGYEGVSVFVGVAEDGHLHGCPCAALRDQSHTPSGTTDTFICRNKHSKSEIIEEGIGSHGGVWGSAEGFYSPPVDSRTLSPSSEAVSGLLPRVFPQNGGIGYEGVSVFVGVAEDGHLHGCPCAALRDQSHTPSGTTDTFHSSFVEISTLKKIIVNLTHVFAFNFFKLDFQGQLDLCSRSS